LERDKSRRLPYSNDKPYEGAILIWQPFPEAYSSQGEYSSFFSSTFSMIGNKRLGVVFVVVYKKRRDVSVRRQGTASYEVRRK